MKFDDIFKMFSKPNSDGIYELNWNIDVNGFTYTLEPKSTIIELYRMRYMPKCLKFKYLYYNGSVLEVCIPKASITEFDLNNHLISMYMPKSIMAELYIAATNRPWKPYDFYKIKKYTFHMDTGIIEKLPIETLDEYDRCFDIYERR